MKNIDIKKITRKYALQNAIRFNGKANPKAVAGRVISENKDIPPKEIYKISNNICKYC